MPDKKLILKIFEGFLIERWNDLIRPVPLVEIDKAAERAVLCYIIGKFEEAAGAEIDWEKIIYASLFDLLRKIALCDIKSPVQRVIRNDYPEEFKKLNKWVLEQFTDTAPDVRFLEEFSSHLFEPYNPDDISCRISRAAHKYSAMREVALLKTVNETQRICEIERGLNKDLESFLDLRALQLLFTRQRLYDFLLQVESLRFQMRWNQTPRIPHTNVLGHSYYVAALTLLLSREAGISGKRLYNNFFSALFHDLPEAVTRDIISPVKQATDTLPDIVKDVEALFLGKELIPLMDDCFRDELIYFTGDEFKNRVIDGGRVKHVTFDELQEQYNKPEFSPVDGKLIRVADHIAAFIEADSSIRFGISSGHLVSGRRNILELYPEGTTVNGIDVHSLFREFQEPEQFSLF